MCCLLLYQSTENIACRISCSDCINTPSPDKRFSLWCSRLQKERGYLMLMLGFYVIAITVLILHFTGFLKEHNIEWLVLVLAVSVFPAVIYL